MKQFLVAAALASTLISVPVLAADVGLSLSIGQPGFYGRINIGDFPQPQVIYNQPVIIDHVRDSRPPVYLRVPMNHRKNWSRYCRQYNACGEQVYFVQDNWYNNEYVPRYQQQHREYHNDVHNDHRDMRDNEQRGDQRANQRDHRDEGRRDDDPRGDEQNRGRDR